MAEQFSDEDKLACLERELKYRIRVFGRLVSQDRMSPQTAAREIALMTAIAADYEARIPQLFAPERPRQDMSTWDRKDMDEYLGDS